MKPYLLALNHAYYFFGTTIYVGVLWALHYFWYPSWEVMNVANVQEHFILPTSAATRFFTVVVPLMFAAGLVMVVTEWRTRFRWLALIALLCIAGATFVGQVFIIPVNDTIRAGVTAEALTPLFRRWMVLNDIRWVLMTAMAAALITFFIIANRKFSAAKTDKNDIYDFSKEFKV